MPSKPDVFMSWLGAYIEKNDSMRLTYRACWLKRDNCNKYARVQIAPDAVMAIGADAKRAVPKVPIVLRIASGLVNSPIENATEWVALILHVAKVCHQHSSSPGSLGCAFRLLNWHVSK